MSIDRAHQKQKARLATGRGRLSFEKRTAFFFKTLKCVTLLRAQIELRVVDEIPQRSERRICPRMPEELRRRRARIGLALPRAELREITAAQSQLDVFVASFLGQARNLIEERQILEQIGKSERMAVFPQNQTCPALGKCFVGVLS